MTHRSPGSNGCRGFTLLELLVTLAVLTVGAAVILPVVTGKSGTTLLAADARLLAAHLRAARETALFRRLPATVTIDLRSPAISGPDAGETRSLAAVRQVSVTTVRGPAREQVAQIVFQPDGSSSGAAVTLMSGTATRTVTIDWLTGSVSIDGRSP